MHFLFLRNSFCTNVVADKRDNGQLRIGRAFQEYLKTFHNIFDSRIALIYLMMVNIKYSVLFYGCVDYAWRLMKTIVLFTSELELPIFSPGFN